MSKFTVYIDSENFQRLVDLVHMYDHERFACLMGNVEKVGKKKSIVIKEIQIFDDDDYEGVYTTLCKPKTSLIEKMMQRITEKRYSVYIEYHTHPLVYPHFSETDQDDEKEMWKYFHKRFSSKYYGNLVLDINNMGEGVIRDWHDGELKTFETIPY